MHNIPEITPEALSLLPAKKAYEENVLPLKVEKGEFHVGLSGARNQKVINEIAFYTGYRIIPHEVPQEIILAKLKEVYPASAAEERRGASEQKSDPSMDVASLEGSNVEFVNQVIQGAVKSGSSDIHLEVYENLFRVRYRIDGHLREMFNLPKERSQAVISRLKIMANLDISEKRRPQDGRIRFPYQDKTIDIRLSTLPTNFGEKVVLRILDKSQVQLDLRKLGLNESQHSTLSKNLRLPYGMILVTGPTGSGKTTTLYASLKEIHSVEKNILTAEDPIEYNLEGINQSSMRPDIGYDFASALRTFLRQDPDIIMVGEIRDKETAEIAVRASLTGHLVLSTLHTNDSVSAITRLIDMGIEPFLVSSSIKLIIAQRLVRTLCCCRKESQKKSLHDILKTETVYEKNGCEKCSFTGYKGRSAIYEILEIDEDIAEMIPLNMREKEIRQKALEKGFITLRDSGLEKIKSGLTTYEEVLRETML
ncbi:MAG TPA: GspE/PulE family protein [Ignavibacteriales bacterium]|nr:GspE/PulE family protein [Ignavibacteriales bacterium]